MLYPTRSVDSGIFGDRAEALGAYIQGEGAPIHATRDGILGEYFQGGALFDAGAVRDGIFGGGSLGAFHVPGLGQDPTPADQGTVDWTSWIVRALVLGAAGYAVGRAVAPHGHETGWTVAGIVGAELAGVVGLGVVGAVALIARK